MPMYRQKCATCDELFENLLKIADRDVPQECPYCGGTDTHRQVEAPMMMDPIRAGVKRPDQGFKEVLHRIHERTPGSKLNESQYF
jgi:putative FmdB family regulatory protein